MPCLLHCLKRFIDNRRTDTALTHMIVDKHTTKAVATKHQICCLDTIHFSQESQNSRFIWIVCLPVTWSLHWQSPVYGLQLWSPSVALLMMPRSLQLQRVQPFGFEAVRPYHPDKQSVHRRPVTATLQWHWPPACTPEIKKRRGTGKNKTIFNQPENFEIT